jgi:HEPN domain-containing protein
MGNNEVVLEWLKFSKRDLDTAKFIFETMHPKPLEIICYHCEQSAEKVLKAFLIAKNIIPPKIHELNRLCEMCEDIDSTFADIALFCGSLTKYGIAPRYPYELEISDEETEKALQKAIAVFEFITKKLEN